MAVSFFRRTLLWGPVLGVLALLLAGCTSPSQGRGPQTQTPTTLPSGATGAPAGDASFIVNVAEGGFNNHTGLVLHVHEGAHVRITFVSAEPFGDPHPISMPCYGLSAMVTRDDTDAATSSAVMAFTAGRAGTCGFSCQNSECHIHPKLQDAKLVVEP